MKPTYHEGHKCTKCNGSLDKTNNICPKCGSDIEWKWMIYEKKPVLKIDKIEFLHWYFDDKENDGLYETAFNHLIDFGEVRINMKSIWDGLGYLPERFILNKNTIKDKLVDDMLESPASEYSVEWM